MKIADKIAKLVDVKSIMTILLTITFCILALVGKVTSDQYLTVYAVVVSFFFGTKTGKYLAEKQFEEKE